jgi:3-phosphoshikimate 1-carboxyvinyltransferase
MTPPLANSPLLLPLDRLPDPLGLAVPSPMVQMLTVRPPGSKSLTNRAILLAALADGTSVLKRPLLEADDARVMIDAVQRLGARVEVDGDDLRIGGVGGRLKPVAREPITLDLKNAGTAVRFLTAAVILSPVPITIRGVERMHQRPIAELVAAMRLLGAEVEHLERDGCPPIRITPPASPNRAVTIALPKLRSSQFVSALLLIAPWLDGGLTLTSEESITSASYARMTLTLLGRLGARVRTSETLSVMRVSAPVARLESRGLDAFEIDIEPDASGATYFWAAGMLANGCTVEDLTAHSLQADTQFPSLLARMGAIVEAHDNAITVKPPDSIEPVFADLSDLPDAAMTLAAVACFAQGRSILRGLGTLRVKETDRIAAMQTELGKIGVTVETDLLGDADSVSITPPAGGIDCSPNCPPVHFDTYDDHRMAMSLALISLRRPNVLINDPACVAKTYPTFWQDFAKFHA